ncbi:hypothetical protein FRB99_002257 [Tulasnella sp. 403]|nr:hypothetical protein FRB99_002257 [Tulasnella sp. 403]
MIKAKERRTFIIGVGMTQFIKPRGTRETSDMGLEAATKALIDAGINYDCIEAAFCGYCYGDSCCGQRALYNLGMTGIPITNVNNNCSTGSTALYQANMLIKYGAVECAMALGFEQMQPGSLPPTSFPDRKPPLEPWSLATDEIQGGTKLKGPTAARMFGNAGKEYIAKYGGRDEHLAKIAAKNHQHGSKNPYAQFRKRWTVQQVAASPKVTDTLSLLMCCPTSDGAACCIIASEDFVHAMSLENQAIEIIAQTMRTDNSVTFEDKTAMEIVGFSMTQKAADAAFRAAGFGPGMGRDQVGVVELHDCFAANELITYDALGLCKPGQACHFVDSGNNTHGGQYVINPSGGLEAKGHPLGATGLGMHFYITTQLRNWAGPMQAPGLFDSNAKRGKYGLVHNIGLGGAVVVTLLRRPEFWVDGGEDGRTRLGYNHAHEVRPITKTDVERARSQRDFSPTLLTQAKL